MRSVTKFKSVNISENKSKLKLKNIQMSVKMFETNYDQSGIDSGEVRELCFIMTQTK